MSEQARHTPGPWQSRWQEATDDFAHPIIAIETCEGAGDVAGIHYASRDGEDEANARLIAAAPDLLTALQAVMAAWLTEAGHGDGILEEHGPALDAARTAVAKATGTSPTGGTAP